MKNSLKKQLGIAVLAALLVAGGYIAYAYFATTGSGTGTGAVGTSTAMTVNQVTPVNSDYSSGDGNLYPGTTQTVHFTVDNPSPGHQYLSSIALGSWTSDKAGCNSVTQQTWITMPSVSVNQDFGPGNSQAVTQTGTITFNNFNTSQDVCKGAAITFTYYEPSFNTIAGSPFGPSTSIANPESAAYLSTGKYLAVNNASNALGVFSVNQTTGAITPVAGSPFSFGATGVGQVAASPTGNFLAIPGSANNSIAIVKTDQSTGTFTLAATFTPSGTSQPQAAAFSPNGNFLAIEYGTGSVAVYAVDQVTGNLTAVPNSPVSATTGGAFDGLAWSPDGNWLVNAGGGPNVSVWSVAPGTGALSAQANSPFSSGAFESGVNFSPNGAFIYLASSAAAVRMNFNTATGALSSPTQFATPGTGSITTALSPNGKTFVITSGSLTANLATLSVNPSTGAMATVPGSSFTSGGNGARFPAFSPDGRWFAVPNASSNTLTIFSVAGQ